MKKLLTIAFALMLGATLSLAQATGASTASTDKPATGKKATTTAAKGGKKGHKGGAKKGKKSSGGTTTPAPK